MTRADLYEWMDQQIVAYDIINTVPNPKNKYFIKNASGYGENAIHIYGIDNLCKVLGLQYEVAEHDDTYDMHYIMYKGIRFFGLIYKEGTHDMKGSKVRILDYMKTHNGITSQDAFRELGITRLSARIKDLRELGYNISTIMVDGTNRYGEPVRFGLYRLVSDKNNV